MSNFITKQQLISIMLIILMGVCLWVGWSDFEFIKPDLAQEQIRESIRFYIRRTFQIATQFFIPLAILVYLGKGFLNKRNQA